MGLGIADTGVPMADDLLAGATPYIVNGVAIRFADPGGSHRKLEVQTRTLTTSHVAFIIHAYCHVGSVGLIDLPKPDGSTIQVRGVVRDCVHSKGLLHVVLFEFEKRIELDDFIMPDPTKLKPLPGIKKTDEDEPEEEELPPISVLYIDDHDADRLLIERCAKDSRLKVTCVDTPGVACDQLKLHSFDIVLCDYHLEGTTGLDTIKLIRPELYTGPIIIVTAETNETILSSLYEGGADAVLTKPIGIRRLESSISSLVDECEPQAVVFDRFDAPSQDTKLTMGYIRILNRHRNDFGRALKHGDTELAREVCRNVQGTAGGFGFERLSRCAERALASIDIAGEVVRTSEQIMDFDRLMKSIITSAASSLKAG
ncbi:MAG TPA: response regulator [Phycisphaerales bacterium]|nr:response regulator [Phycisphaerales bacterium]